MAKRFSPNDEEKTVRSAIIRASQIRQSHGIVCGIDVRTLKHCGGISSPKKINK